MKKYLYLTLTFILISSFICINKYFVVEQNSLLQNESQISRLNSYRPKIYIYSDFGGGENQNVNVSDLQTSQEIASAAWKSTLQQMIYINDTATPLTPISASLSLAKTFPYKGLKKDLIHSIIVHVIDPGVGNGGEDFSEHRRSIVLRKDGFLFIGPDNGTLTHVCPPGSIARIWKIEPDKLYIISGIDIEAGGTFHGRDLFSEAAFRIASGEVQIDDIATPYKTQDLQHRISKNPQKDNSPIVFEAITTNRFVFDIPKPLDNDKLFSYAYLIGIVQSPLYQEGPLTYSQTKGKKIFLINQSTNSENYVAILNTKTKNVYIGPNNGLATTFFRQFGREHIKTNLISKDLLNELLKEKNNEKLCNTLFQEGVNVKDLKSIEFYGSENDLIRDSLGRPKELRARIFIDPYGNVKTTALSTIFDEAKKEIASKVIIKLNGIEKKAIFADTFFAVPKGQLFVYNGSSATYGPNPHRSRRYVEVSSNGIYGEFGKDFFINDGLQPFDGQEISFTFDYQNSKYAIKFSARRCLKRLAACHLFQPQIKTSGFCELDPCTHFSHSRKFFFSHK